MTNRVTAHLEGALKSIQLAANYDPKVNELTQIRVVIAALKPDVHLPPAAPMSANVDLIHASIYLREAAFKLAKAYELLPDCKPVLARDVEKLHQRLMTHILRLDPRSVGRTTMLPPYKDYTLDTPLPPAQTARRVERIKWHQRNRDIVDTYLADTEPGALGRFKANLASRNAAFRDMDDEGDAS